MSRRWGIVIALGMAFVILVQFVIIAVLVFRGSSLSKLTASPSVVVIRVDDVIMDSHDILERINLYKDRSDVKAVILRMETPGGSVAASQEIANAVNRLRRDGKIVVTSVANLGASGGYYIASQCNAIVVNPGSLVGSIGVIMEHVEFHELAARFGIKMEAITSGAMKEVGTPTRPMRPDERALIQNLIGDAYGQFRGAVLHGRQSAIAHAAGLSEGDTRGIEAALDAIADGRIMTGAQAVKAGLADETGDMQDAIRIAGQRAGIEGEPNVIYDEKKDPWEKFAKVFGLAKIFTSQSPFSIIPPSGLWYLYR